MFWACRLEDSPSRFPLVLLAGITTLRGTRSNRSREMQIAFQLVANLPGPKPSVMSDYSYSSRPYDEMRCGTCGKVIKKGKRFVVKKPKGIFSGLASAVPMFTTAYCTISCFKASNP